MQALRDFGVAQFGITTSTSASAIDRALMSLGNLQRFLAARGSEYLVPMSREAVADGGEHDRLVVHCEDGRPSRPH